MDEQVVCESLCIRCEPTTTHADPVAAEYHNNYNLCSRYLFSSFGPLFSLFLCRTIVYVMSGIYANNIQLPEVRTPTKASSRSDKIYTFVECSIDCNNIILSTRRQRDDGNLYKIRVKQFYDGTIVGGKTHQKFYGANKKK